MNARCLGRRRTCEALPQMHPSLYTSETRMATVNGIERSYRRQSGYGCADAVAEELARLQMERTKK